MSDMTSMERVLTTLQFKEPDRVPLFLLLSLYGAKELQLTPKEYFSNVDNIVQGQLRMQKKYRSDCYDAFFHAAVEIEAWGGEVVFVPDGPPNAGEPLIQKPDQIASLKVPSIQETPCLLKVLDATTRLHQRAAGGIPIIGVVLSPFSAPVMQMGFEAYLKLLYFDRPRFELLMKKNMEFCIAWANAQIKAGATAICYFDPLAAPSIIGKEQYLQTGYPIAQQVIASINAPVAVHLASAPALPVVDEIVSQGAKIVGFSCLDDAVKIKRAAYEKICLLGNLNGIEMANWTPEQAEQQVKQILRQAGLGGGLILSDNHGEIPWAVTEETLLAIAAAVERWGRYPLKWVDENE